MFMLKSDVREFPGESTDIGRWLIRRRNCQNAGGGKLVVQRIQPLFGNGME
jgi:hypothetical protein